MTHLGVMLVVAGSTSPVRHLEVLPLIAEWRDLGTDVHVARKVELVGVVEVVTAVDATALN